MSVDFYLFAVRKTSVYGGNLTHNLIPIAEEAGLYEAIWRPDEIGIKHAEELIPILEKGLEKLRSQPDKFKKLNPENDYGSYDGFVNTVEEYLTACKENPDAEVAVWR